MDPPPEKVDVVQVNPFMLHHYARLGLLLRQAQPLGFFLGVSVFSAFGAIDIAAVLLLALGMAFQAWRMVRVDAERFFRLGRYAAVVTLPYMILFPSVLIGWRSLEESSARASLPESKSGAPNVLLVVWDTVRTDSVGTFHPDGAPTPHLDSLAAQGVAYERAVSPASWTLPSHASMFTGRFPNEMSADWFTALTENHTTIAEVMRGSGYDTAGFVANTRYCGRSIGMDQGFTHFEDYKLSLRTIGSFNFWYRVARSSFPQLSSRKKADEINSDFVKWLDSRKGRPFFAFLNYLDAHTPYLPEKLSSGRPLTHGQIQAMRRWDSRDPETIAPHEVEFAKRCYEAQITHLDQHLGLLLDELKTRNELDNTVLIVVSDHGEQFGEHGMYYHGNSLYRPAVHVPLVIVPAERLAEGVRVKEAISTRNLAATILDTAGIEDGQSITGESLLAAAFDRNSGPAAGGQEQVVYAHNSLEERKECGGVLKVFEKSLGWEGPMDLWVTGDYFLMRRPDGKSELYNMASDPHEKHNLAEDEEFTVTEQRLRLQLNHYLDFGRSTHVAGAADKDEGKATAAVDDDPDSF